MLTRNRLILLAAGGSLALLMGAYWFQYGRGLVPCVLCWWQRYPHFAAVAIGALALALPGRVLPVLGLLAALTSAGIGLYHVGVETGIFEGLASCSVDTLQGISGSDLLNTDISVGRPAACGTVPWSLFGISMAGWNVICSAALAGIWALAARRS